MSQRRNVKWPDLKSQLTQTSSTSPLSNLPWLYLDNIPTGSGQFCKKSNDVDSKYIGEKKILSKNLFAFTFKVEFDLGFVTSYRKLFDVKQATRAGSILITSLFIPRFLSRSWATTHSLEDAHILCLITRLSLITPTRRSRNWSGCRSMLTY